MFVIESVAITNWQSLRSVHLPVGRFTVIVGASSSGKSAFMRAMRALASNVRGTGQITRGKHTASITASGAGGKVTLEYSGGAWRYRLVEPSGAEREFGKLNAQVPVQVTEALRIEPVPTSGTSVNFAAQFDPPFLIGDTGSVVARVLGELTNVDRVFTAVREANRRRAAAAGALKTRQSDLQALTAQLDRYRSLPARLAALERAETADVDATVRWHQVEHLERLLAAYDGAEQALASVPAGVVLPSSDLLDAAAARLAAFSALLAGYTEQQRTAQDLAVQCTGLAGAEQDLQRQLQQVLAQLGTCPTCGQPTARRTLHDRHAV